MDGIKVLGGHPLHGEIAIQGSKNAILPIIAGTILHDGITVLHNCPKIQDVMYMVEILKQLGCRVCWTDDTLMIDASCLERCDVPADHAGKLRSSIILLGSLLGRLKEAHVPYPGGCTIGARPIDLHLQAFRQMGVCIEEQEGLLLAQTKDLCGARIHLRFPSVGATENIILGAVLAKGTTVLTGAAREPEIVELAVFLNKKGARITGMGSDCICIRGVDRLHDSEYTMGPDRIVAGTYVLAALGSRGCVTLWNAPVDQIKNILYLSGKMGASLRWNRNCLRVDARRAGAPIPFIETNPYPGFPTDLQSQLMAVLCMARGNSCIRETVFEARFHVAEELNKMGARVFTDSMEARIEGVDMLTGCDVQASELRGGAALTIAGLMAEGVTRISNKHFIDRGYVDICEDLKALGARISPIEITE